MVLRGEQIQRCGLGGCTHLTSHTLFKPIAELYPTCACTPIWSCPGERVYLSSPEPLLCRLIAISHGTLTAGILALC
jgi:hypothetical protein